MDLADQLIERMSPNSQYYEYQDEFDILDSPNIIFRKHPSIYRYHGELWHEHSLISCGDQEKLYELIDLPSTKMTKAQSIWLYNRLFEKATDLTDRIVLVSKYYAWDKDKQTLVPICKLPKGFVTQNEATTKSIRTMNERA